MATMPRLTECQLELLAALERKRCLDAVHEAVLSDDPAVGEDTGLRTRLDNAYRHAQGLGFTEGPAIAQFLYYEAFAPSFHAHPTIDGWLRQPGMSVERRFADLLQLLGASTA
jgi:hypothetical protein